MSRLLDLQCVHLDHFRVEFVWLVYSLPGGPAAWILSQKRWSLMEFFQLVDVLRVDTSATEVRWVALAWNMAPLSTVRISQDLADAIRDENFELALLGVDPSKRSLRIDVEGDDFETPLELSDD